MTYLCADVISIANYLRSFQRRWGELTLRGRIGGVDRGRVFGDLRVSSCFLEWTDMHTPCPYWIKLSRG